MREDTRCTSVKNEANWGRSFKFEVSSVKMGKAVVGTSHFLLRTSNSAEGRSYKRTQFPAVPGGSGPEGTQAVGYLARPSPLWPPAFPGPSRETKPIPPGRRTRGIGSPSPPAPHRPFPAPFRGRELTVDRAGGGY